MKATSLPENVFETLEDVKVMLGFQGAHRPPHSVKLILFGTSTDLLLVIVT